MPRPIPVFLEGYDVFGELARWREGREGRDWSVLSIMKGLVVCRLSTRERVPVGVELRTIQQAGDSPQEAVWRAIEEWKAEERLYGRQPRAVQEGAVGEPERQAKAEG